MAKLEIVRRGARGDRMAVCIHGIFSDHNTFTLMLTALARDPAFDDWDLAWFDYDFHQAMEESGRQFAIELERAASTRERIVIVAHSMGGLVSRFAILDRPLDRVARLIMLGTPNCGAIRTAGLSWLAQAALLTVGTVFGVFTRRTGVRDLTRVRRLFNTRHGDVPRASHVEYVTIPGLFYHAERGILEAPTFNRMTTVEAATELVSAMQPLFRVRLQRPHDGIVEESSNRLAPSEEGSRWSEKKAVINHPERPDSGAGYAHVTHERCAELTHVELHADPAIVSMVGRLIVASDYNQFRRGLTTEELNEIKIEPGPDGRW